MYWIGPSVPQSEVHQDAGAARIVDAENRSGRLRCAALRGKTAPQAAFPLRAHINLVCIPFFFLQNLTYTMLFQFGVDIHKQTRALAEGAPRVFRANAVCFLRGRGSTIT